MGIKHLWAILTPFGERKPLYELQGKTVAVDLSCWICEAQNVTDYYIQPKMYLRNLYFRTCYLLLTGVSPVFVLEGKAPDMKHGTIAARNELQFKGAKPRRAAARPAKDRSKFHFVLQRCEEMLRLMGLACVKGEGEAEALCARLNEDALVDGCISQDSDCFAYGARIVYRNFSISQHGGGTVDVYDVERAARGLRFGRNKMVALALLCGSDYNDGVFGVGKEAAMKLFETVSDEEVLERLRSWKGNPALYEDLYRKLNDKNVCTSCGHSGKMTHHTKNGCPECRTTTGCDISRFRDKRLEIKNEVAMRGKALADPGFPDENLVKEFLERKDGLEKLDLNWKRPNLANFIKFTSKHLQWEAVYALEKFLPVVTRWQLLNYRSDPQLKADRIKKNRTLKGVPSYEIIWSGPDLIPAAQQAGVDAEKLWSTVEPQQLVREALPDLVSLFERSKKKPKKRKKNDLEAMMANASISEPPKARRKCKTIDSYFKTAVTNLQKQNERTSKPGDNDASNRSRFGDEDDVDVSDIIDEMLSRSPPQYLQGLVSSFFCDSPCENDLFERSLNNLSDDDAENLPAPASSSSDEDELKALPQSTPIKLSGDAIDDTFDVDIEYVPLLTRLKGKIN